MNSHVSPNAIVIDTGSYSTKIGFAGSDEPQSIVRTATGIINNDDKKTNASISPTIHKDKFGKYLIDSSLKTCDQNKMAQMDIEIPYNAGVVSNMDALSALWMNTITQKLRVSSTDLSAMPILLSEPSFWSATSPFSHLFNKFRENYCQSMFEELNVCAMYLCKDAVLSSFSHGHKSSVVLDLGNGATKCTPVYDGYVLNKGCKFTKCCGDYFHKLINHKITKDLRMQIVPKAMLRNRNRNMRESFKEFEISEIITDIKEKLLKVRNTQFESVTLADNECLDMGDLAFKYKQNDSFQNSNDSNAYLAPLNAKQKRVRNGKEELLGNANDCSKFIKIENEARESVSATESVIKTNKECLYVLPDGQRIENGDWQYFIPELLFTEYYKDFESDFEDLWIEKMRKLQMKNECLGKNSNTKNANCFGNTEQLWLNKEYRPFRFKGIASMVNEAINGCDIDIRKVCMSNVIICGGHSRFKGIIERISKELSVNVPYSYKYKLCFNDIPRERLFNPWLGGSIMASTTHFQNMWITKEEYNECGASIVQRKCY